MNWEMVTGLGLVKVTRMYDAFHKPFFTQKQRERKQNKEMAKQQGTSNKKAAGVITEPKEQQAAHGDDHASNNCQREMPLQEYQNPALSPSQPT
jgi:hypothetical protein